MIPEIGRFNIFRAISLLGTTGKSLILLPELLVDYLAMT
ncbi:hypothetical protein ML8_1691 [Lactococcus lactis subsp. lactis]|nr:hypothetical protein ML8_1691 [Lactococcus lactis subsp. lactis]